jgi:hypothetical protein
MMERKGLGIVQKVAESVIRPMVVELLDKYSGGSNCVELKKAIILNWDLYQIWLDNYRNEGVQGPEDARKWTAMAPSARGLLTPDNVRKWLLLEKKFDILRTIDTTYGGKDWFERTINKFREELWKGC